MKVVCIIQARMGSTRLPGKMLLPLAGAPLIQRVIERVQRATKLDAIVLAVPYDEHVNSLEACIPSGVHFYPHAGPESDLVGRYLSAAQAFDAELIVRIPGDNPCVEPDYLNRAVEAYLDGCLTFYSNTRGLSPWGPVCVDGLGAEVFSMSRLHWLDRVTQGNPALREHPHQTFYTHADCGGGGVLIQCHNITDGIVRLDVNTQADYEFIKDIYEALYPSNPQFTITDILTYLHSKEVPHAAQIRVESQNHQQ